jgi:hypothetical protein
MELVVPGNVNVACRQIRSSAVQRDLASQYFCEIPLGSY